MRVSDLIKLLEDWQTKHGPDAQMSVVGSNYNRDKAGADPEWTYYGQEIYINDSPISTVLDSRGPEVVW